MVKETHKTIRGCKDQCNNLVSILYKNRDFDTIGVLSSAAHCNRILQQCLQRCTPSSEGDSMVVPDFIWKLDAVFVALNKCLASLSKYFMKLFGKRKNVIELINRVRISRQIDNSHRELFHCIEIIEKQIDKEKLESIVPEIKRDSLTALIPDTAYRDLWVNLFGENETGKTDVLVDKIANIMGLSKKEKLKLAYILDHKETGVVNIFCFTHFVSLFGPMKYIKDMLGSICSNRWFYGYTSAGAAEKTLKGCPPGTFIIRFSQSKPGCIVISCVSPNTSGREDSEYRKYSLVQQFTHILVEPVERQFRVKEFDMVHDTAQKMRLFSSFQEILSHYSTLLQFPLPPSVHKEVGFHKWLVQEDANSLLARQPSGSYLFRFDDSACGDIAVSFVAKNNEIKHVTITESEAGFTMAGDCHTYISLSDLVQETNFIYLKNPLTYTTVQAAHRVSVIFTPSPSRKGAPRPERLAAPIPWKSFVEENSILDNPEECTKLLKKLFDTSKFYEEYCKLKDANLPPSWESSSELFINAAKAIESRTKKAENSSDSEEIYDESEDSDLNAFEEVSFIDAICFSETSTEDDEKTDLMKTGRNRQRDNSGSLLGAFAKSMSYTAFSFPFPTSDSSEEFALYPTSLDTNRLVSSLFN